MRVDFAPEVIAWPVVHDAFLEHTLAWLPELRRLPRDLAREPWRLEAKAGRRVSVQQCRDSPLWFCSANRVNWKYEYGWLCGHAWTADVGGGRGDRGGGDSERDKWGEHRWGHYIFCFLTGIFVSPQRCQGVPFPQSVKIHYFCRGPISADPVCPQPR